MTVFEFLEYLFKGRDTRDLALDLAWVYEARQASATAARRRRLTLPGTPRAAGYAPGVKLGDIANADAAANGKPLDGIRVLAVEQMQALPYATQLLTRLGAEVVKIEPPAGESGRGSHPGMLDPEGRFIGATFLRNNLSKRSVAVDLKHPAGRDLVLRLAPRFDVFAENFKPGTADRLGIGYADVAAVHPTVVYVSVSGAGNLVESPYSEWPAYASMAEAVSGIYEYARPEGQRPRANPVGALGDISSGLFAVIGTLAALRHREERGIGQHVDISMFDAVTAMTDIVTNLGSLGIEHLSDMKAQVLDTFQATDGFFVLQLVREHQFERLANLVGHPEWLDDPRFATRDGWGTHKEDVLRPAIEAVGGEHDEARGHPRAERRGHRRQPLPVVQRGARRPPPAGARHARGDGAHRRRRHAGADPRQPGEDVEGRRGSRVAHPVDRRAHRRRARRRARPRRRRARRAARRRRDFLSGPRRRSGAVVGDRDGEAESTRRRRRSGAVVGDRDGEAESTRRRRRSGAVVGDRDGEAESTRRRRRSGAVVGDRDGEAESTRRLAWEPEPRPDWVVAVNAGEVYPIAEVAALPLDA